MIITISGKPGSGKSTVAKLLAEKYNLKKYSTGDYFRQKAKEKGVLFHEYTKLGEGNPAEIEKAVSPEIDTWQTELGKKEDNFIIDGRLSHKFIPNAIKIFLDVSKEVGAIRIMNEKRDDELAMDEEHALHLWETRAKSEQKRFHEYYKINHHDYSQYDFVLDTSNLTREEVLERVSDYLENQKNFSNK